MISWISFGKRCVLPRKLIWMSFSLISFLFLNLPNQSLKSFMRRETSSELRWKFWAEKVKRVSSLMSRSLHHRRSSSTRFAPS